MPINIGGSLSAGTAERENSPVCFSNAYYVFHHFTIIEEALTLKNVQPKLHFRLHVYGLLYMKQE